MRSSSECKSRFDPTRNAARRLLEVNHSCAQWPAAGQASANLGHYCRRNSANCVGAVSRKILKERDTNDGPKFAKLLIMLHVLSFSPSQLLLIFSLGLASLTAACGGEVDSGKTPDQGSGAGAGSTAGSGSTAGGSSGVVSDNGQYQLADCVPGFPVEQASAANPCKYFIGTTCYSKQKEACACACPRDQGPTTLCIIDANSFLPGTDAYGVFCVAQ